MVAQLRGRVMALALNGLGMAPTGSVKVPLNIAAASIAGSFISIVREWLNMKPLPTADRVTEWIWSSMTSGVSNS